MQGRIDGSLKADRDGTYHGIGMKGMFGLMGNVLILAQKKGLARSVAEEINCRSSARKERLKYEDGNA